MQSRSLAYFPVQLFAVIMGFSGLTIAWAKAYHILKLPYFIYEMLLFINVVLFFVIFVTYMIKWAKYPDMIKEEFNHPIKSSFFPAMSISFLLVSISMYDYAPSVAVTFWFIGAPLHLFFTFRTIRYWLLEQFEIKQISPAWFIPIVGNVLVPVVGVDCMPEFVSLFYFSIGLFFWVVLFTIVTYRMIFHHPLPAKLIPTLFILIAPPAVGFISYFRITFGEISMFSAFLYLIALFITILLLFKIDVFLKLPKFFISWWAYTFPLAAITIATLFMNATYHNYFTYIMSWGFLVITSVVVGIVSYKTIEAMKMAEICIKED